MQVEQEVRKLLIVFRIWKHHWHFVVTFPYIEIPLTLTCVYKVYIRIQIVHLIC